MTNTLFQAAAILLSFLSCSHAAFTPIKSGSKIPPVELHWGFNPVSKILLPEYVADQKVLIVSAVGAFLPSETARVRTYLENQDQLEELGIQNVLVCSVNDGAVVGLWNQALNDSLESVRNKLVTFLGDPSGEFTRACGMLLEDDKELGLVGRSKRFVLCVENNVVSHVISQDGDNILDETGPSAPAVIRALNQLEQPASRRSTPESRASRREAAVPSGQFADA